MTDAVVNILLLEDEPAHAEAIRRALEASDLKAVVHVAGTLREYREAVAARPPDIALLDLVLPDGRALDVLTSLSAACPFPILIWTSYGNERTAVEAMKAGALDYVVKSPEAFAAMPHTVKRALREWNVLQERKRAEAALREAEARYRVLFEGTKQGILVADAQTQRFAYANQAVSRMLGYTTEDLLRMGVADIHPQESLPLIQSEFEAQIRQEKMLAAGLPCLRKDGTVFYADINSSPIHIGGRQFNVAFFTDVTERKQAEERLHETLQRLRVAITSTIRVIGMMVEARDPYTSGHQQRTTVLAEAIAVEMGLSPEKIEGLRMAGHVHDVGKISIPAEILSKPTRLTPGEFKLVKTHAQKGYEILKDVEFPWPLAEIVHQHHERCDGSGYPRGLKGAEILIEARILAVSDTVEAITSNRPYRPAPGLGVALEEIDKNKGVLFDPDVAAACLKLFKEKGFRFED